MAHKTQPRTEL